MLTMLRLAGIPLYASERTSRHPLMTIGGIRALWKFTTPVLGPVQALPSWTEQINAVARARLCGNLRRNGRMGSPWTSFRESSLMQCTRTFEEVLRARYG